MNLATVVGSGPLGRIVAADVEAAAATAAAAPPAAAAAPAAAAPAKAGPALGTSVPFTAMQGAVARNMEASLAVPIFHVGYTVTTDALDALYKKVRGYRREICRLL